MLFRSYQILKHEPDFQIIHQPEVNILCFRYVPPNVSDNLLSDFQLAIRNRIREGGKFFISKVEIDGINSLRVVFMNHKININHFHQLLDEIRKIGLELISGT